MRQKRNVQPEFDFQPSHLKLTQAYYRKYEAISRVLDDNFKILDLVHQELKEPLEYAVVKNRDGSTFRYTSETVLRIVVCQMLEGASLREIVIRIDDSNFLRRFVRIYNGPMMDFTTYDKLKNSIQPSTWEKINGALARYAVKESLISGEQLRLDTTAVEANIHWPTDSALLWDTYRVLARLIERVRDSDPRMVGNRRLLLKKVKRLYTRISRQVSRKGASASTLKCLYERLIQYVEDICQWSKDVWQGLKRRLRKCRGLHKSIMQDITEQIRHYLDLGQRVINQASRRVLHGEQVPNEEKLFSIFEPHTELLKRGKAGKPIEFGHMIQIQQVAEKFITDYDVFEKKPVEPGLLEPAIEYHKKLFGAYPEQVTADKGYYEGKACDRLGKKVNLVSIAKKGKRTDKETERETDPVFRHAQRFRAGVEGTISFMKRILKMFRCHNKGWAHYVSTIGATVFAHNLLILTRL